ncbi:AAA family ATPase [Planktothrix paucivesiculata]|uniref:ATP-binding protein n=1 Tax=Planktothrix paucivesiculata PCC 9631 TaxID=671071 RepID=A0A7Z9BX55_9CYAN|nr:AAA family ATPase [Planktothrix paucivesiculata]VXD23034.1 ATP-binding protein [Planktothrix paucivesiculata PCC 9631]
MEIHRLTLTTFRGFKQAEFEFEPGMNLLVGINGVGKSTVLDALRITFSRILPEFTACEEKHLNFNADDIRIGFDRLAVEVHFQASGIPFQCNVSRGKSHDVKIKPNSSIILESIKKAGNQPLVVYFSTRRSILTEKALNRNRSLDNQSAAFADALIPRMLRLQEFTDWWLVQEELLDEKSDLAQRHLNALNDAVRRFFDWFTDLRVLHTSAESKKTTLLLEKDGVTLNINQLSDGERGILALILDLVQRLLQANPDLEDPLQDGKALVLIDELDLHLHPSWQRMVVQKLTEIFPNCQFIATTHSPQIIGEVQPTGLILLKKENDQVVAIQEGLQAFGLDSSWILKHLMETEPRNLRVQDQINSIEDSLEEGDLELARNQLDTLKRMIYGRDDEVFRLEASINNLEALADEVDSEEE